MSQEAYSKNLRVLWDEGYALGRRHGMLLGIGLGAAGMALFASILYVVGK